MFKGVECAIFNQKFKLHKKFRVVKIRNLHVSDYENYHPSLCNRLGWDMVFVVLVYYCLSSFPHFFKQLLHSCKFQTHYCRNKQPHTSNQSNISIRYLVSLITLDYV